MAAPFAPEAFHVTDIASAMRIILTPEGGTTEERWRVETPYVSDLISKALAITSQSLILDYGCGIGRLGKALIEKCGCTVIGVDLSPTMGALSHIYVQSDRFVACSNNMLKTLVDRGVRFDGAYAVWALQHSPQPDWDIGMIKAALNPGMACFVLNAKRRAVPTRDRRWHDDEIDIRAMLTANFRLEEEGMLPAGIAPPVVHTHSFWATLRRD
jgi:SAM-dependent methyltransferase